MPTVSCTPRFRARARVPFLSQLAREFSRTEAHVWWVITGARKSPLLPRLVARQAELLAEARDAAIQEPQDRTPDAQP